MLASKVSVIVPCFNHAGFVATAVDSILRQTYANLEVILIDDCSRDTSWEKICEIALSDSRVKTIRHEVNRGLPRSRNDGMDVATGDYIAFCDADDIWEQHKLSTQVQFLEATDDFDIAYCETLLIDGTGAPTGRKFSDLYPLCRKPSGWLFDDLVGGNFINVQSALMRRGCLASVSHFDEDLPVLEDWWYWVQLARKHRFYYSEEVMARYRVHGQSMNAMKKRSFPRTRVKIYRRMMSGYPDLRPNHLADIAYTMGVDLAALGRRRAAQQLLLRSVRLSLRSVSLLPRLGKAATRLALTLWPSKAQAFDMPSSKRKPQVAAPCPSQPIG